MARIAGLIAFVLIVASASAYVGKAQEADGLAARVAALERRLAAMESAAPPASSRLAPDGTLLGVDGTPLTREVILTALQSNPTVLNDVGLVALPEERLTFVCQTYDPLYLIRVTLSPWVAEELAPNLVGLACGQAPRSPRLDPRG